MLDTDDYPTDAEVAAATLDAKLAHWFTFHPCKPEQGAKYERIRAAALAFARVVAEETPPSADQSAAFRKIREAVFTANAATACGGV